MTNNNTFTYESGPLVDELAELSANAKSVWKGIAVMATKGKLGALAKELGNLAEQMEKVYTPPERKAEAERFDRLAKSVQDKSLAAYYKDRARKARNQMGESR